MRRAPWSAFLSLAIAVGLVGAGGAVASAEVTPTEQAALLAAHNQVRSTVAAAETARLAKQVTIPALTWSPEAATVAQAWADHLLATDTFEHNANRGPFGENIYWEGGFDPATSAERAVSNWASEQANYTWDTNSCNGVCGHYTQIVWANTTGVGCGKASDGTQTYWVCDYAPPGNWNGERPYEPGAAVTVAPSVAPVAPAPSVAPVAPAPSTAPVQPPASTAPVAPAPSTAPVAPAPSTAPVQPPASTAPVAPGPSTAPVVVIPGLTPQQSEILTAHNAVRQSVAAAETARLGAPVTIPALTWNPDAAAVAQAWADNLLATGSFEHNANRGPFGENIYWESGFDPATSVGRAVGNWAGEQVKYNFETDSCSIPTTCFHYLQLVWAKTTSVGCASATDGTQTYWVCDYAPPGNMQGERPYEPGAAPAQPSAAPAQPSAAPAQPSAAPAQPSAQPAQPSAAPAQPSAAPAQPSAAPAAPSAAPVAPEASLTAPVSPPPVASAAPSAIPAAPASLLPCAPVDPAASIDPFASPVPCISPVPSLVASFAPEPSLPPVDPAVPSASPAV